MHAASQAVPAASQADPAVPARAARIDVLQLLRGIAATLVAGFHLFSVGETRYGEAGALQMFRHGEFGVDLFFVLSGFIIFYISSTRPGMTMGDFARGRFFRILPPYWAILALNILVILAGAALLGETERLALLTPERLVVSTFLLPYPAQIIIIAWTLSLELVFYLIFCATFFRFGARAFFAAMALWGGAALLYTYAVPEFRTPLFNILLHTSSLEFLAGSLIAVLFLRGGGRVPFGGPVLALGLVLSAMTLGGGWEALGLSAGREVIFGVPAACLIYGLVSVRLRMPAPVLIWGEASYLLYLGHLLAFQVLGQAIARLAGVDVYASAAGMLFMLVAATLLAYTLTLYAEIPYRKWYRKWV